LTDTGIIKQLFRTENKAMVEKDLATLNEILAPSMELTHMTSLSNRLYLLDVFKTIKLC